MGDHPFDNAFIVTPEQAAKFQRDGFVKLEGFFNANVIATLLDRVEVEMGRAPDSFKSEFSRLKYDFESEKTDIYDLLERPYFRRALTGLTWRDLFFTFELCFELEKNVSKGFPWHVGVQSFGYQVAEEFGCTIWAPLHRVDTQRQRGGVACVPENVISGKFIYQQIEPAIVSTLESRERAGIKTGMDDYFALRSGILNAPAMLDILEAHQVEDSFAPGDVLLFTKYVIHRSIMLEEGSLPKRAAFVMRFVEAGAHYDLQRARNLEYPVEKYGYKAFTHSHMEIGLADGAVLSQSSYFADRDRRMIKCDRSLQNS
ncbi:MAG: hypothetical protein V6Z86_06950 [Hyphomicrobiales bacterium]